MIGKQFMLYSTSYTQNDFTNMTRCNCSSVTFMYVVVIVINLIPHHHLQRVQSHHLHLHHHQMFLQEQYLTDYHHIDQEVSEHLEI